jgi:hypothetical protein
MTPITHVATMWPPCGQRDRIVAAHGRTAISGHAAKHPSPCIGGGFGHMATLPAGEGNGHGTPSGDSHG